MSVKDVYSSNSKFLKAPDLGGRIVKVVITGSVIEKSFDNEMRIVLSFRGANKRLTLNKTNAMILLDAFGDNEAAWVGREVELAPGKTGSPSGQVVDTINVRIPFEAIPASAPGIFQAPIQPSPLTPSPHPAFDDDIPFFSHEKRWVI